MIDQRSSDRYIIDTPESIEFGYDLAGLAVRFLAAVFDVLLFIAMLIIAYRLYDRGDISESVFVTIMLGSTIIYCVYYIFFEALWNGQTPGKRLLGIRVVQETGRPVTFSISMIRNLIRIADFFPVLYGTAIVFIMFDKRSRRLGDIVAGTLVVRDRRRVTLDNLLDSVRQNRVQNALSSNTQQTLPNLEALHASEMQLVQTFLLQRSSMPPERRQRLSGQLAYALFQRLGYSVPGDPELFLQQANDQYLVYRGQASLSQAAQPAQTATPLRRLADAASASDGTSSPVSEQNDGY